MVSNMLRKAPEVTAIFWVMKILATTLGETGGDALSMSMELGYVVSTLIFGALFLFFVSLQVKSKQFNQFLYWTTIVATTTVGTTLADFFDRDIGIGYLGGSLVLFTLLLCSIFVWYKKQGRLSVDVFASSRDEIFYWVTIMFSQTLGTALGDWFAEGFGYGISSVIFSSLLIILIFAYFYSKISKTLLFWTAFILTRPLGATVGDYLDKPIEKGGLDLSRYTASFVLLLFIILCMTIIHIKQNYKKKA